MSPLPRLLKHRLDNGGPIRVGVIGAGKFASMFLNQVPFSPHLEGTAIDDVGPLPDSAAVRVRQALEAMD